MGTCEPTVIYHSPDRQNSTDLSRVLNQVTAINIPARRVLSRHLRDFFAAGGIYQAALSQPAVRKFLHSCD